MEILLILILIAIAFPAYLNPALYIAFTYFGILASIWAWPRITKGLDYLNELL